MLISYLMGDEDYHLEVVPTPSGFRGRFALESDPDGESYIELVVLWVFGVWMTI